MQSDKRILQSTFSQEIFRSAQRMFLHIADDPSIHIVLIILYWFFDLIQLLAFPFNMEANFMWRGNNVMGTVMSILAPIMFLPTTKTAAEVDALYASAESLYFSAIVFLILLWGSFIWGTYYHVQPRISALDAALAGRPIRGGYGGRMNSAVERDRLSSEDANNSSLNGDEILVAADNLMIPYWFLRFIRTLTFLGLHAVFIPVTAALFSPFYCPSKSVWPTAEYPYVCLNSGHLGFFIVSIILLPLWIAWNIIIASCIINRVPDLTGKRNLLCASHGRVFAAIVILKTLLCGIYTFAPGMNPWFYCIIVVLCSFIYTGLYWQYLPFFHQWVNQVQLSIGCVLITASVTFLCAQIIGDSSNFAGVAACLFMILPSVYVGYALGSLRFRSFARHVELFSPFAVELRMRFLLSELIDQVGNANDAVAALSRNRSETLHIETKKRDITSKTKPKTATITFGQEVHNDEEIGLLHNRKDVSGLVMNTLNEIDTLFRDASTVFGTSAILQLFYSNFLSVYMHNEHLERVFLNFAESRADQLSFDIQFFVRQRRMEIRTSVFAVGNQTMTIERRMQFENIQELSRVQVADVRNLILAFWTELSNKHPDLQKVQEIGTIINNGIADTRSTFRELLSLAPQSASVMRAYADCLLELANDPTHAMELLNDAEQLEDERSKSHNSTTDADLVFGTILREFDLSSESLSWCKVSADPTKLGVIVDVNSSMQKLFGYNRRELIGREISFLIPEPIGSIHMRIMLRYQSTGKERVVNQSRVLLALHRNGYIFPVKANIRPTATEFITVFEEIPSNLGFIFV